MKIIFDDIEDFYVNVTETNVHIHNSYKIKGKEYKLEIINRILTKCPEAFKSRTINSIVTEWKAHNVLYKHHFQVDRTQHTDIETNQELRFKIGYAIIALFGRE